ncbi:MAG: DUF2442 domain-containing protein [Pseudomonadota bacterium]|nr:DUF2442 domain-containing protein [Pseudomonadota bacterium]
MVNYRRSRLAGGSYFVTFNLAERRLRLLTESHRSLTRRLSAWAGAAPVYGTVRTVESVPSQGGTVHGKCQGRESKAEIIILDGIVTDIRYSEVAGRVPLDFREMQHFTDIVSARGNDIVQKWIDFFVLHKSVKTRTHHQEIEMSQIPINIITAKPVGDYCLHLTFDDGKEQTVDFKPFLISAHVDRTRENAVAFMGDLSERLVNRVQISSDSLRSYMDTVEKAFGADVDYGQIVQ